MERYIGLDVHAASTTAGVLDGRGKKLGCHVVETNGQALVEFLQMQAGTLHVCLEEGTQAGWLVEILSPRVAEVVVVRVSESSGQKNDALDAFDLAERLRTGAVASVYKQVGCFATLRHLVKAHRMIVADTVRVQNRIKALYRARGIPVAGKRIYTSSGRVESSQALPESARVASQLLFEQYDALCETRERAHRALIAESHRHAITKQLESCPGIGPIRAAQLVSVVVAPERFRTRQQFWSYCGLGIVMRSSSDWVRTPRGGWTRATTTQTRGLNRNHNSLLKGVFKGAATTVIQQHPDDPLHKSYERLLEAGTKPNLAKLTLARKLAAITLSMWKKKEAYDPAKTSKP